MKYSKKDNIISFNLIEFVNLFKEEQHKKIDRAIYQKGYTGSDLYLDNKKMKEVLDLILSNTLKNKEDIEIFAAIETSIIYYGKNSSVCFDLKSNFNHLRDVIRSLNDLKKFIREDTLMDFGILNDNGLRQFQLKQYKEELNTDSLFSFIKKIVKGYGSLGDVNLLVILQGKQGGELKVNFRELHKKIETMKLSFGGEILLSFNEENKFNVINRLYPKLSTWRKKIDLNYLAGEIMYN